MEGELIMHYDYTQYSNILKKNNHQSITPIDDEVIEDVIPKTHTVINCRFLNVRKHPIEDSIVIQVVKAGTKLEIDYVDGDWTSVILPSGHSGYAMTKYISI